MTNRMDIVCPRAGSDGKTYWTKIGSAWPNKTGGYSLTFEALPLQSLNDKGQLECRALLMEPRDNGNAAPNAARPASRSGAAQSGRGFADDLNDDVPF